jgi:hypothetical protein
MADFFDRLMGTGTIDTHTADTGQSWSPSGTAIALDGSGGLKAPHYGGDSDFIAASNWTPPGTDYAVSIVLGAGFRNAGITAGVLLRGIVTSFGNWSGYVLFVSEATTDNFQIFYYAYSANVNTASHQIGTTQNLASQVAAGDTLTVSVADTSPPVITVYHNGTQIYQVSDTNNYATSAGQAGVEISEDATGNIGDVIRTVWAGAIGGPSAGISPPSAAVAYGAMRGFSATGQLPNETLNWSAGSGSVSPSSGSSTTYTAPGSGSSDSVTWTSADLPMHTATASIMLSAPVSTSFHIPENNASSTVATARSALSPSLVLADGSGFGTAFPKIVTVARNGTVLCILEATARSWNTLTISQAIEGTMDTAMVVGDTVELRPTKLAVTEIQDAVSTVEAMVGGLGSAHRNFSAAGTVTLNGTTPPVYLDRPGVCNGLAAACGTAPSGGPATVTIQTSTDGTTWSDLGSVSISSGSHAGTAAAAAALSSGTFLRGKFTAVNGVADLSATLYLMG